ncbi:MAG: hypothetical protein JW821_03620, partial [Deltaproteobacteria bacterium]|nr:hypothetical protein [Deltaproteobacteria bacterium]
MKSSKVLIEHQCPQCGAPATLEETDHLFTCEFCRVKSFLLSGDFFRYLLPDRAPADRELFYVPYWRFKGLLFSCVPQGIKHRIMDVSFPALNTPCFPVSLGLRSQVLKLRFASTEAGGRFLKPDISLHEAKGILEERFSAGLPKVIFEQSFVGEAISQIYSPFFMDGRIHDGVLNRALKTRVDPDFDPDRIPGGSAEWPIRFIPALCPDCGWDLQGERDSLALACRNCNALWLGGKTRFVRMKYGRMPS